MRARSWGVDFRVRQYVRGSLWIGPLLGGLAGAVLAPLTVLLDQHWTAPVFWQYSPSTASTVLTTIVGAMAALTGFVVTVTVLVVQMATGTFSARYMRLFYRDRMLKVLLAVLIGTLTFAFSLLRKVETNFVPNNGVTVAGWLMVAGLLLFLVFLDRFVHRLRPVAVAALVAGAGREAFAATQRETAPPAGELVPFALPQGEPEVVVRAAHLGAIQAIDGRGLAAWAEARDCVLVLPRAVGDFVAEGAALIRVHGAVPDAAACRRELGDLVALGIERTIEQDPAFALRILVDIADKALSAAVNDPTTAVQILGYVEDTLRVFGNADLSGRSERRDADGRVRVVVAARTWEDYLALGVTEIREYGATSIQVVRRLRAVLEDLRGSVRPEYVAAVDAELARLDATVTDAWGGTVDEDRARVADVQGMGGPLL